MIRAGAAIAIGAICACLLVLVACGDRAAVRPGGERLPDLVLVTLDTTRADHLGCYGRLKDGWSPSPVLDALGAEGRVFGRARASTPLTLPSHATMLTGLEPPQHGVRENNDFRLAAPGERSFATVSERLRARGYRTAAFTSARVLARDFGLAAGFEHWDEVAAAGGGQLHYEERDAVATTDAALAFLDGLGDEPLFLWVHYFDPHHPHERHGGRAGETARVFASDYDGEIGHMDGQIGRLLAALRASGRYEDALVLVVGDHGEGLGEHGEETHGFLLHEATLRVPLILKPPRGHPLPVDQAAATADVAPTLLAAAGLPPEGPPLVGRDLLASASASEERSFYAETVHPFRQFGWSALQGIVSGDLKLVVGGGRRELHDLAADPGELRDLAAERPDEAQRLERLLRARRREMGDRSRYLAADPRVADLRSVRANGYAGGPSRDVPEEPGPDAKLAHPGEKLAVVDLLDELTRRVEELRALENDVRQREVFTRAQSLVRTLEDRERASPAVLFWLGRARLLLARSSSARELGEEVRGSLLASALRDLGDYLALRPLDHRAIDMRHMIRLEGGARGDLEALLEEFRAQEGRGLADGLAWALAARALEGLGRREEALRHYERAVELAPERSAFALDRDRLRRELD